MSGLNELMLSDLRVFFNENELAEKHTINGKELTIIPDEDKLAQYIQVDGLSSGSVVYHVPAGAYGSTPKIGEYQSYDGKDMIVHDFINNKGVYQIALTGYSSGNG